MAKKQSDKEIKVLRANVYSKKGKKDVTFFDLEVNGVSIYGCTLVDGKKGTFTSFPSYKGSNDKYYHYAWVELDDTDQAVIEDQIQELLEDD